jgi:hypothetical protein
MEYMDELSSMMMLVMIKVMIKDMMLVTMLGMSFVTPFTLKISIAKRVATTFHF